MTSIQEQLSDLSCKLPATLLVDRDTLRKEIRRIRRIVGKRRYDPRLEKRVVRLSQRISQSAAIRLQRLEHEPDLQFDETLPITARKDDLLKAFRENQVIIVSGETGSGKSTQLPKICLCAGLGVDGRIGITQPRRIAAMTVARRIAQELNEDLGQTVGYQIRFRDTTAPDTRVKIMTDGILLAEIHKDPFLYQYDVLIVDEAHERSLNIDFILGFCKKLLKQRPEFKLIITSATLDTEKLAATFSGAPVIHVSGRLYAVETLYLDPNEFGQGDDSHIEKAVQVIDQLNTSGLDGDVLVFMPTEQDIRDTCELLVGRRYPGVRIIPLFARLTSAEQQRVFQSIPAGKVVVATNVAETSITIPGIRYVIDTGLARISQYNPRSRTTTLPVAPISQSSADQRMGRCGRVANGICFRLFSQESYNQRSKYTPPEIVRSNLAEVILKMIALNLGNVEEFPFIDPPNPRSIHDGYKVLQELGAIKKAAPDSVSGGQYQLTQRGRLMARLPLDPRLACILLSAQELNCLDEIAIIAAALSIQDPRERPLEKQTEADRAHSVYNDPRSDFLTLYNIWLDYQKAVTRRAGWNSVKKYCRDHFLSFRRMREWQDIYRQIIQVLADHRIRPEHKAPAAVAAGDINDTWYAALHRSITSGFLSNIALKKEKQFFNSAHNRLAMIFPGSAVFKKPGQWIVAAEMVETSRLFARCVAIIDPAWILDIAPEQCHYTYLSPHWERRQGQVLATEQVRLYGLPLLNRKRPFGPVDPDQATAIFVRSALIEGDVRQSLPFMVHNKQLIDSAQDIENRLRRRDLLVEEDRLEAFYKDHLSGVYDWRTLKRRIKKKGNDDFLRLAPNDVFRYIPDTDELSCYPDRITTGAKSLPCDYRFVPGQENDGITVRVPEGSISQDAVDTFQWLVPGLFREKVAALIKTLPKEYRRQLLPINSTVDTIISEMPVEQRSGLDSALSRFIHRRFGIQIPASAWDENQLADHLRMRIAVTDEEDNIIRTGRDSSILRDPGKGSEPGDGFRQALEAWERRDIQSWDFGDLPESVTLYDSQNRSWLAFPGLEERDNEVVLTARRDKANMRRFHPQGVKALLCRHFTKDLKFLRKNLRLSEAYAPQCRYFGGINAVQSRLLERVLNDAMARDIRTFMEFDTLLRDIESRGLTAYGQSTRQRLLDVLDTYSAVRKIIYDLEQKHVKNGDVQVMLTELRGMLQTLVPENFMLLYDDIRLEHLVRYVKAIGIRAQRAVLNLEKDSAKTLQYAPFAQRLKELINDLHLGSSDEKKNAVEEYFWMIEEFKISLFAQEIGTNHTVSAKRLSAQLSRIERMS